MTKKANLFSLNHLDLLEAKNLLEEALGIALIAHESDYHGGDYFKMSSLDFNIVLQTNFMEDDGETTEAEYPDALLLLYINGDEIVVDKLSEKVTERGFNLRRSSKY